MRDFEIGGLIRSQPLTVELHPGEIVIPAGMDYREVLRRLFEDE